MMYNNKLVCSVKVRNKILREKFQDNQASVFIPFGSEYSLLLKNLGGRNAVVHIEIDGKKVSETGFYIRAGQTADIERFVESLTEGRRFKFIEKTEEISDFRGDKIDDGIIRVTWQFEKPAPEVKEIRYNYKHEHDHYYHHHHFGCNCWWCRPGGIWYGPITWSNSNIPVGDITQTISGSSVGGGGTQTSCFNASASIGRSIGNAAPEQAFYKSSVEPAPGITVEGSKSFQRFGTAYANDLETNVHSMVILLKGFHKKDEPVSKPTYVREKKQCSSCGRRSKGEYCPNCGTAIK